MSTTEDDLRLVLRAFSRDAVGEEPVTAQRLKRMLRPMTPEEREAQRRSFAYGNTRIDNDNITREMVDEAAERLRGGGTE